MKLIVKLGLSQMAPVWLKRKETEAKIIDQIMAAADSGCNIVAFGEALLPGYPFWVEATGGAAFNDPVQKTLHAHYQKEAVQIEAGHLEAICAAVKKTGVTTILGIIERPPERAGFSLYASLVYIGADGVIHHVHRKLMPTYEERLVWSIGDGNGLRTQKLGAFTVGGLNCWENWLPLARASLYGQGEDLHFAIWPGADRLTKDITRFIAKEGRSFVASVSGLMRLEDIPDDIPHVDLIRSHLSDMPANGGSCLAGPDGEWIIAPVIGEESLLIAEIDHERVREERHNMDVSGHYSRPDVTRLTVNRERQHIVHFDDGNAPRQ